MKPCEIPCPKCGNIDISRKYHKKDEPLRRRNVVESEFITLNPYSKTYPCESYPTAKKEFLEHHCRCCQYQWDSDIIIPDISLN